jgi:DNA-binding PadR family transcriptional regulator
MGPLRKFFKLNDAGREELWRLWERWEFASSKIKANPWPHSDLTGGNLMPILDGVLGLLEETPWYLCNGVYKKL